MTKLTVLVLLVQLSCASIVAPSYDTMHVAAAPSSAVVSLNGDVQGPAPMRVNVPRQGNNTVEVSAPGYGVARCNTEKTPSGGYIAADVVLCVLFFPLGCISFIDAGGAWNHLASPNCHVKLSAQAHSCRSAG